MSNDNPIRFLVEQYYDVQKLRIEAFNRIVASVGNSHGAGVTQDTDASHIVTETQLLRASQRASEIQPLHARHLEPETQSQSASHQARENQKNYAMSWNDRVFRGEKGGVNSFKHATHFISPVFFCKSSRFRFIFSIK